MQSEALREERVQTKRRLTMNSREQHPAADHEARSQVKINKKKKKSSFRKKTEKPQNLKLGDARAMQERSVRTRRAIAADSSANPKDIAKQTTMIRETDISAEQAPYSKKPLLPLEKNSFVYDAQKKIASTRKNPSLYHTQNT